MQEHYKTIEKPSQERLYKILERVEQPIDFQGSLTLYNVGREERIVRYHSIRSFLTHCIEKRMIPLGVQFQWREGLFLPSIDPEQERCFQEKFRKHIPAWEKYDLKGPVSKSFLQGENLFL